MIQPVLHHFCVRFYFTVHAGMDSETVCIRFLLCPLLRTFVKESSAKMSFAIVKLIRQDRPVLSESEDKENEKHGQWARDTSVRNRKEP